MSLMKRLKYITLQGNELKIKHGGKALIYGVGTEVSGGRREIETRQALND
jgi:hypothetical protein